MGEGIRSWHLAGPRVGTPRSPLSMTCACVCVMLLLLAAPSILTLPLLTSQITTSSLDRQGSRYIERKEDI